jgi:hypothetical protein
MKTKNIDFTVIIPTLGIRKENLLSLLESYCCYEKKIMVILVIPENNINKITEVISNYQDILIIKDKGIGLAAAINLAIPKVNTKFWNWCGDDDFINISKLEPIIDFLSENSDYSFAYGNCVYVSHRKKTIAINRPNKFSSNLLRYTVNLIPQPSVLFRLDNYYKVGGLEETLKFAFDQEYYERNLVLGKACYFNSNLSQYMWHKDTLTNQNRLSSLRESYLIRKKYSKSRISKIMILILKYPTYAIVLFSSSFFTIKGKLHG